MTMRAIVLFCCVVGTIAKFPVKARAWQTIQKKSPLYPEEPALTLKRLPKTAVSCSGGGARAYIMCLGQLSGLHELGLMDNVRYLAGVSGGDWAVNSYVYSSEDDDQKLLGPLIHPESMSLQILQQGPKQWNGLRYLANGHLTKTALVALASGRSVYDAWTIGVQETYLSPSPANITAKALYALNEATVEDIKRRNPSLANSEFVTPNPNRPFPVDGFVMDGPVSFNPSLDPDRRRSLMMECTPMYCGAPMERLKVTYTSQHKADVNLLVGGIIEPFAFSTTDTTDSEDTSLGLLEEEGIVTRLFDPIPGKHWSFGSSPAASSYVPGGITQSVFKGGFKPFDLGYHSVLPNSKEQQMALADGGIVQSANVISFLQRGMDDIIVFYNTPIPLASAWDPSTQPVPNATDCEPAIPLLFGIVPSNPGFVDRIGLDYNNKSHVFDSKDFPKLMKDLNARMFSSGPTNGTGAFVRVELTTVGNLFYGIFPGRKVNVTFFYNAPVGAWERILMKKQPDTYAKIYGAPTPSFRDFPYIKTTAASVPNDVSNALGSMAGWSVLQNRALFEAALGKPKGRH